MSLCLSESSGFSFELGAGVWYPAGDLALGIEVVLPTGTHNRVGTEKANLGYADLTVLVGAAIYFGKVGSGEVR